MEKKSIGQFIAALRKANGFTQQEIADRLNVSNKAISRWERDECAPDVTLIAPLAEILGVTCDELLKGERITAKNEANASKQVSSQVNYLVNRMVYRSKILTTIVAMLNGLTSILIWYHLMFAKYGSLILLIINGIGIFLMIFMIYEYQDKIKRNELVQDNLDETNVMILKKKWYEMGFLLLMGFAFNAFLFFQITSRKNVVYPENYISANLTGALPYLLLAFFPYLVLANRVGKTLVFKEKLDLKDLLFTIVQFVIPVVIIDSGLYFSILGYRPFKMIQFTRTAHFASIVCLLWFVFTALIIYRRQKNNKYLFITARNMILWLSVIAIFGYMNAYFNGYQAIHMTLPLYREYVGYLMILAGVHFSPIYLVVCALVVGLYYLQVKIEQMK